MDEWINGLVIVGVMEWWRGGLQELQSCMVAWVTKVRRDAGCVMSET